jgi:hypothetical protein
MVNLHVVVISIDIFHIDQIEIVIYIRLIF